MKKETVFIKSLINTFIALIVCFNFFSCSNKIEESGIKSKVDDVAKYDEKNYIKINYINSDEWKASSDYIGMKGGEQNLI